MRRDDRQPARIQGSHPKQRQVKTGPTGWIQSARNSFEVSYPSKPYSVSPARAARLNRRRLYAIQTLRRTGRNVLDSQLVSVSENQMVEVDLNTTRYKHGKPSTFLSDALRSPCWTKQRITHPMGTSRQSKTQGRLSIDCNKAPGCERFTELKRGGMGVAYDLPKPHERMQKRSAAAAARD